MFKSPLIGRCPRPVKRHLWANLLRGESLKTRPSESSFPHAQAALKQPPFVQDGGSGGPPAAVGAQAMADLLPPASSPVHLMIFMSGREV